MVIVGVMVVLMIVVGYSLLVVLLVVLVVGVLVGLWNGIFVVVFKIQFFVVMLILMVVGCGVVQLIIVGQIVIFDFLVLVWFGSGLFLLFLMLVIVVVVMLLLFWLFICKMVLGMFIEVVGINICVVKNVGVNICIVVMLVYVLSGVCVVIVGIIVVVDICGVDVNNVGLWFELDVILVVVIGGVLLMGGCFNLLFLVVGVLIIQGMNIGILFFGFLLEFNQVVKVVVVLCVLIVQLLCFIGLLKGVCGYDKM